MRRPEDRRCIAVETALLELFRLISVCIAEVLVRIERDIVTPPWCDRFGLVPRLLLAAGLSGYRPRGDALERASRPGWTVCFPAHPPPRDQAVSSRDQAVTLT